MFQIKTLNALTARKFRLEESMEYCRLYLRDKGEEDDHLVIDVFDIETMSLCIQSYCAGYMLMVSEVGHHVMEIRQSLSEMRLSLTKETKISEL